MDLAELITAISPIISAIIGVLAYSSLTNYRLDQLDKQVSELKPLTTKIALLEDRVDRIEKGGGFSSAV